MNDDGPPQPAGGKITEENGQVVSYDILDQAHIKQRTFASLSGRRMVRKGSIAEAVWYLVDDDPPAREQAVPLLTRLPGCDDPEIFDGLWEEQ